MKRKLIIAKKKNKLPKILIPVHLGGLSCDMLEIKNLAKKFKFKIIEDASHAIGGRYRDKPIGSCKYSDITVFSFHPVKIITSGDGGMALTNYKELTNITFLDYSRAVDFMCNEFYKNQNIFIGKNKNEI